MACDCKIIQEPGKEPYIQYCAMHQSAELMYNALGDILNDVQIMRRRRVEPK